MQAQVDALSSRLQQLEMKQERGTTEMRLSFKDMKEHLGTQLAELEKAIRALHVDQVMKFTDHHSMMNGLAQSMNGLSQSVEMKFAASYVFFCHQNPQVTYFESCSEFNTIARSYNGIYGRRYTLMPIRNDRNVVYPNFPVTAVQLYAMSGEDMSRFIEWLTEFDTDEELLAFGKFYCITYDGIDMKLLMQRITSFIGLEIHPASMF